MSNPIFTPEDIIAIARLKRDNNWSNEELAAYLQGKPMSNQDKSAFPIGEDVTQGQFAPEPGMSLREYAAIKLRVPDSGTDWLDAMIERSLRDEFAGKAVQAWISTSPTINGVPLRMNKEEHAKMICEHAYDWANVMLKASKGE